MYSGLKIDMSTNPDLLSLLRDLTDPGKWRRVPMWPGPSVIVVCNVKDVQRRAGDILREMEGKDNEQRTD